MAGETINKPSSAWVTAQAAASVADAAVSAGARTTVNASALSANEKEYPLVDFQLILSVGTSVLNDVVDIYRTSKADATNESPATTATFLQEYVGQSFVLDGTAATKYFYVYGVPNVDPNATYYLINNGGATLTLELKLRTRGWNTAV